MAKVFSVFSSLGGSTIGYKRAGCEVIGGCEIDPKFVEFYVKKHNPQHMVCDDARVLVERDFPFLHNLDILDGSPPCTLFSSANIKADAYKGKKRKFEEGQKEQVLDELVLVFAKIIKKYRPKYFVMENVAGLMFEKNRKYLTNFFRELPDYAIESGLLNSADLGLPQFRVRSFFVGKLNGGLSTSLLNFTPARHVSFAEIEDKGDATEKNKETKFYSLWKDTVIGNSFSKAAGTESYFNHIKVSPEKPLSTITVRDTLYHYKWFRGLNEKEVCRGFGLPDDFMRGEKVHFRKLGYIVPPIFYERIVPRLLNW